MVIIEKKWKIVKYGNDNIDDNISLHMWQYRYEQRIHEHEQLAKLTILPISTVEKNPQKWRQIIQRQ